MLRYQYRIESSRSDERPTIDQAPFFEGATIEKCDKQAIACMEKLAAEDSYAWNDLTLTRIDVQEVRTHIGRNTPKDHTPNSPRTTTLNPNRNLDAK